MHEDAMQSVKAYFEMVKPLHSSVVMEGALFKYYCLVQIAVELLAAKRNKVTADS
jgi:hypothetical protein